MEALLQIALEKWVFWKSGKFPMERLAAKSFSI